MRSIFLAIFIVVFAQGCMGSDNGGDAKTPTEAGFFPVNSAPSTAMLVSDLAYKHGYMAINQRREFETLLDRDNGCALAAEYTAAIGQNDLTQLVPGYCTFLNSQNIAVRDCARAQEAAAQIVEGLRYFERTCSNGRPERSRGRRRGDNQNERRARAIVNDGLLYRAMLGLPAPERLFNN